MKTLSTPFQPEPQGRRGEKPIFAVGDLHGYADALITMLTHLEGVIAADYTGQDVDLVFLGDYVDRGPDPNGVITLARAGLSRDNVRHIALMGNHDRYLLQAAEIGGRSMTFQDWSIWLANGGGETLQGLGGLSYGSATPERVRDALGPANVAWLEALKTSFRSKDVLCVHAGVDPDVALDEQTEQAMVWIREPFLSLAARTDGPWPFAVTVVHGHTIGAHGLFANRIGVDTGGYATGVFSAVEIAARGVGVHHVTRR